MGGRKNEHFIGRNCEGKCRRYDIGPISETLEKRIRSETDLETLGVWLKKAARASTVEEFEQEIA